MIVGCKPFFCLAVFDLLFAVGLVCLLDFASLFQNVFFLFLVIKLMKIRLLYSTSNGCENLTCKSPCRHSCKSYLLRNLAELGIKEPTPIQRQAIPVLLSV